MTNEELNASFCEHGFLGPGMVQQVGVIRDNVGEWFPIAEELSRTLQALCRHGQANSQGTGYQPQMVGTRLLMRGTATVQGTILLAERGMVANAQTLARSFLEDAYCMAALALKPDEFLKTLEEDSEAAIKRQSTTILAIEGVDSDPESFAKYKAMVDGIKSRKMVSPKDMAELTPMSVLYLPYQLFSNESAHPSAWSLSRHIEIDHDAQGLRFRWGPGSTADGRFTLWALVSAGVLFGLYYCGIMQGTKDPQGLAALTHALGETSKKAHALGMPTPQSPVNKPPVD